MARAPTQIVHIEEDTHAERVDLEQKLLEQLAALKPREVVFLHQHVNLVLRGSERVAVDEAHVQSLPRQMPSEKRSCCGNSHDDHKATGMGVATVQRPYPLQSRPYVTLDVDLAL